MLQRDLGIPVEFEPAPYGTLEFYVDGRMILDAGPLAFMGAMPAMDEIRQRVAEALGIEPGAR
jgi:hypothetical protein